MMRDILEYIGALSEAVSPFPASVKDIDERSFNVMPENFFKVNEVVVVIFRLHPRVGYVRALFP